MTLSLSFAKTPSPLTLAQKFYKKELTCDLTKFKTTTRLFLHYWGGGGLEWDSKEWDNLSLIGATREILEIRKEWDSIEWD